MTALDTESVRPSGPEGSTPERSRFGRLGSVEVLAAVVVAVLLARGWLLGLLDTPRALTLVTVFVSIMVQAMPFLILGTILSAAITAFVPARFFERALPRRTAAAVPVAGHGRGAAAGVRVWIGAGRRRAGTPWRRPRRRVRVPAGLAGDQPGGPHRDRGRVSRRTSDGRWPASWRA